MSRLSASDLRALSSGRWLLPILAAMSGERGSRFGALASRLGISRPILSRSLDALESFGWIVRNPGHGHPLRPEYLLTPAGLPVATWCAEAMEQRERLGLERHDLGRWSLPLVRELRPAPLRFAALQANLAPVTPRALSLTLKRMDEVRLVRRLGGGPPLYGLTERGDALAALL